LPNKALAIDLCNDFHIFAFGLPEGITLLITDALSAPANFILHRTLAAYMKDRRDVKCVI
jgi:hypothetical protein